MNLTIHDVLRKPFAAGALLLGVPLALWINIFPSDPRETAERPGRLSVEHRDTPEPKIATAPKQTWDRLFGGSLSDATPPGAAAERGATTVLPRLRDALTRLRRRHPAPMEAEESLEILSAKRPAPSLARAAGASSGSASAASLATPSSGEQALKRPSTPAAPGLASAPATPPPSGRVSSAGGQRAMLPSRRGVATQALAWVAARLGLKPAGESRAGVSAAAEPAPGDSRPTAAGAAASLSGGAALAETGDSTVGSADSLANAAGGASAGGLSAQSAGNAGGPEAPSGAGGSPRPGSPDSSSFAMPTVARPDPRLWTEAENLLNELVAPSLELLATAADAQQEASEAADAELNRFLRTAMNGHSYFTHSYPDEDLRRPFDDAIAALSVGEDSAQALLRRRVSSLDEALDCLDTLSASFEAKAATRCLGSLRSATTAGRGALRELHGVLELYPTETEPILATLWKRIASWGDRSPETRKNDEAAYAWAKPVLGRLQGNLVTAAKALEPAAGGLADPEASEGLATKAEESGRSLQAAVRGAGLDRCAGDVKIRMAVSEALLHLSIAARNWKQGAKPGSAWAVEDAQRATSEGLAAYRALQKAADLEATSAACVAPAPIVTPATDTAKQAGR